MQKLERFGPLLVFLAAMLWATDAPFRFHLTRELSANFIVLAEHAVNVLLVLPFLFLGWKQIRNMSARDWLSVLCIGIGASAVASILFTKSFAFVNPSVAILLQKLQPLIAITLATLFLREHLTKRFWLWGVLALAGAYVISFPDLIPRLYIGEAWNPNATGALLALGAAALWALGTVLGRYSVQRVRFETLTALRFAIAFLFLTALNFRAETIATISNLTPKDILFIIIVAVTSGFISLLIYYKGLTHTKASIATLAELGFPLLAVIVNAAFLHAFLKPAQLLGMALLLFAIWKLTALNRAALSVAQNTP
ncbi:MAG: DMT family transporter [bacterium]|nr:DMT family transporter [bacterium]